MFVKYKTFITLFHFVYSYVSTLIDDITPEVENVIELANLVHRKYFVSQKIFGDVTYNP